MATAWPGAKRMACPIPLSVAAAWLLASRALAVPVDPAVGNWIGGMDLAGRYDFVSAKIEGSPLQAKVSIYFRHVSETILVARSGPEISASLPVDGVTLRFLGKTDGDVIRGRVIGADGTSGAFVLRRWRPIDEAKAKDYTGAYEIRPGVVVTVHVLGHELYYFDQESGRYGMAMPRSQTEFFAGPTNLSFDPVEIVFRFRRDGPMTLVLESQGRRRVARKGAFHEEEVRFQNGAVRLAGTLRLPNAPGPHPAVVLICGSGAQTRDGFDSHLRVHADVLAANHFAVLNYDKRGVGASTGDYHRAGPEDLAGDAAAAVAFLRSRSEVDPNRIGLLGFSQGGMVEPFVASADSGLAFVANIGGTIVDGEEQEVYRVGAQMKAEGYPDAEIREGIALQVLKFFYARTRLGWESYLAAVERNRDKKWLTEIVRFAPTTKDTSSWDFWRRFNVNLAEKWARVRAPVLLVYGEMDPLSPIQKSLDLFRDTMRSSGNVAYEVKLYPRANHDLLEAADSAEGAEQLARGYHRGYLEDLVAWMKDHTRPRLR